MAGKSKAAAAASTVDFSETVTQWYKDAEKLLLRARAAAYWRHNLTSRHSISFYEEPTKEQKIQAYREANAKADKACDAIEIETAQMEEDASALAERFNNDWIDLFFLKLRNIEIEQLPSGRCALVPLQNLVWRARNWGRELTFANQRSRTLNCGEVVDWMERERWVNQTVDAIRERLYHERLVIEKKLQKVHSIKPPAERQPKPTTNKTLKAARLETLQRFLEDAAIYKRYEKAKQITKTLTLRQYAAKNNIRQPNQLQNRYHRYTNQGWTPKNVEAELNRKLADNDS